MRLLLIMALAGCATDLNDSGYLPYGGRDASAVDQFVCSAPQHHTLAPVPIDAFEMVDPAPTLGRAIRVRVRFHRTACGMRGPTTVVGMLGNATDFVTVTQQVWDRTGEDCVPFPDERVIVLSDLVAGLSSPTLILRDASSTTSLTVKIAPPSDFGCALQGEATMCHVDCECGADPTLRCVPIDATEGICAHPCDEDADCPNGDRCLTSFTPVAVCSWPRSPCSDGQCPFGQRCANGACAPAQAGGGEACTCDQACGFGAVCAASGFCLVPCATNRDCPGSVVCDNGACDVLR